MKSWVVAAIISVACGLAAVTVGHCERVSREKELARPVSPYRHAWQHAEQWRERLRREGVMCNEAALCVVIVDRAGPVAVRLACDDVGCTPVGP